MRYNTILSVPELAAHLNDEQWAVVDCRFSLADTTKGLNDYLIAHIPGAVYGDLDKDLSGPPIPGKTGRHPLPLVPSFAETLCGWGIGPDTQVVAYDDAGGSMAARLWWMLNWIGHPAVALLDGGWQAWQASGLSRRSGDEHRDRREIEPNVQPDVWVDADQVDRARRDPDYLVLDARSGARFRGEGESIDPVAGHIPGAVSLPYQGNLTPEGKFLAPDALRRRFEEVMRTVPVENVICYCGSGVTAAHNLVAMAHAGIGRGRLYVGSWSDWITNPTRPIERVSQ